MAGSGYSLIEAALAVARTRTSWNRWLEQAERPASDHEEAKIERAASMARDIVNANTWLSSEGAQVLPQGSYYNNTNVRLEADMDLRVQFSDILVEYQPGVDQTRAYTALGYMSTGKSFRDISTRARSELAKDLIAKFGTANVDTTGNKAITVDGLDGSRADCDLVPAFRLHVVASGASGQPYKIEGVAILGKDGSWTQNFPQQHHDNGIAKRARTSHRFKRNVRMLKRLNYELEEVGDIPKRMPSFFVECLVYRVEDAYFLNDGDDRYLRLLRVLTRLQELLADGAWCQNATEVNDVKCLFRSAQTWSLADARGFVSAALSRLVA